MPSLRPGQRRSGNYCWGRLWGLDPRPESCSRSTYVCTLMPLVLYGPNIPTQISQRPAWPNGSRGEISNASAPGLVRAPLGGAGSRRCALARRCLTRRRLEPTAGTGLGLSYLIVLVFKRTDFTSAGYFYSQLTTGSRGALTERVPQFRKVLVCSQFITRERRIHLFLSSPPASVSWQK